MTGVLVGPLTWSMTRDEEGHRDYTIVHEVRTTDVGDGPTTVMLTPGLPLIGSVWAFDNDLDPWAYCWPTMKVSPRTTNEPGYWWEVEQTFSTRPIKRCQDVSIENPLLEPDKISGSFTKYQREAIRDRFGNLIKNSAHQQISGSVVEVDHNRPTVTIEKNLGWNPLAIFSPMIDTVNDAPLWGLPARTVKLSNVSWTRNFYGICTVYYTVRYEFDVRYDTFDLLIADVGTAELLPGGTATNPKDFAKVKDRYGENFSEPVPLNGAGEVDTTGVGSVTTWQVYAESNFFLLGIPAGL